MRQGEIANYAEKLALETVIEPVIQRSAVTSVFPNHPVSLNDGSTRYVDFALITEVSRIAIEIDGYTYHAEGAITREAFDDQLHRQNELTLQGWTVVRFSFDQLKNSPEKCKDQLRRLIISDPYLHRNFTKSATEPSALQIEVLNALSEARQKGKKRGVVAIPTGTGKTILSALDAKALGGRVLFIVHNNEILKQAALGYKKIFPDATVGFINSEHQERGLNEDLIFANIASLRSPSSHKTIPNDHFDYVVIDEFHHGAAPSYAETLKHFKPKFMLGLTATPERTDRKDVLSLLDNNLIYSISTSEAIERGFLVPFTYYGLHDNVDYSDIRHNGYRYDIADLERSLLIPKRDEAVIEKYRQHAYDKKSIGFCVSIKHAERMADAFCDAGIPSIAVHSNLPREERARRISLYERGVAKCVFVRDLFNEGVDFPDTTALLFLRPTESRVIFLQQLGRGLRIFPNKTGVVVLDFIGNYIGASEIPRLLRSICSGTQQTEGRPKPEFVYQNGCRVYFSEKTIENLSLPDFKIIDKAWYVEKIFILHRRLQRSLTPLDLYIEFGERFGHVIASMRSYKALIERMNSFRNDADEELEVINSDYSKFEPSESLLEIDSLDFLEDRAGLALDLLESVQETIRKSANTKVSPHRKKHAEAIHRSLTELTHILASTCLVKNTITAYAEDYKKSFPPVSDLRVSEGFGEEFFNFLAKASYRRNSFAVTNFLKSGTPNILRLIKVVSGVRSTEALLIFFDGLMERKTLNWITDFHDLTSPESLNT